MECCYDSPEDERRDEETKRDLGFIGGKRLRDMVAENPGLLVFPPGLGASRDGAGDLQVCSYSDISGRVHTGNMMGFIGVNDTQMSIRSRFADKESEDFFLHHMLVKVFCPNIVDLRHGTSKEEAFDFLLYLFPHCLDEALRQGLFRTYRGFERNDCKVNGAVDLSRHIRDNTPFKCAVAYRTRELSFDNPVTQLIRHTIEYLKTSPVGRSLLSDKETQDNVRLIVDNTGSYRRGDRREVLASNRKGARHPYFTRYAVLQRLCVGILRHEELKYGSGKDKIHGILFDGAWLWEEYLNTLFRPLGMVHAENRTKRNPIRLFEGDDGRYLRYPDFFLPDRIVIDAKYKRSGSGEIAREDMHQIISYLHVLDAKGAYIACPTTSCGASKVEDVGILKGLHGKIGRILLRVPQNETSLDSFSREIRREEDKVVETLKTLLRPVVP